MSLTNTYWHSRKFENTTATRYWGELDGYDIHALYGGGSTRRLDTLLRLTENSSRVFSAKEINDEPAIKERMGIVKIEFIPRFQGIRTGQSFGAHGISVNIETGQVTATSPPALQLEQLRSFIIESRVTIPDPAHPGTNTDQLFIRQIRVHLHESIRKVWLTPSTLTVAKGINGNRFSVLAEFDDDVIGDITRMERLSWSFTGIANTDIEIDVGRGDLKVNNFPVEKDVTVTLPTVGWGGKQATAKVIGTRPWSMASSEQKAATLLSGPGAEKLTEAANVLFISEGFTEDQKEDFEELLTCFIAGLKSSRVTMPFNCFVNALSMNYWSIFLPSHEKAVSILYEISKNEGNKPIPVPIRWEAGQNWRVENFIYQFGLPTSKDVVEIDTAIGEFNPFDFFYKATVDLANLPAGLIFPAGLTELIKHNGGKLSFAGRMTTNNKNDLLSLSTDVKYKESIEVLFKTADNDPLRYDSVSKKLFYRGIVSEAIKDELSSKSHNSVPYTNALNSLLVKSKPLFQQHIAAWKILYGTRNVPEAYLGITDLNVYGQYIALHSRALINERDTALGLGFGDRPKEERSSLNRIMKWNPLRVQREHLDQLVENITDGVGGSIIGTTWTTGKDSPLIISLGGGARHGGGFIHNLITVGLAHSDAPLISQKKNTEGWVILPFELERTLRKSAKVGPHTQGTIVHELAHALGLGDEYGESKNFPDDNIVFFLTDGNVQPEKHLLAANSTPAAIMINGDKLRWRWPRIKKAAVLVEKPFDMTPENTTQKKYVISLRSGQKNQFKDDDIVYLRQRPLLKKNVDPLNPQVNPAEVSGKLRITGTTQVLEQVVVIDVDDTLDPNKFSGDSPNESVLFMPVPAPEYARLKQPPDEHAELVARVIRDHIKDTGYPLNRTSPQVCEEDNENPQLVKNLPAITFRSQVHRIVGAFDGGHTYYCGVYHPTGGCLMRSSHDNTSFQLSAFCHVCVYCLVDKVDPALHPIIDNFYLSGYPIPAI